MHTKVPPSGGATDHGDDGETRGRRRMGVPISRGGNGRRRAPHHRGVHQEVAHEHSGEGGLTPRLCNVNKGGEDAGDKLVSAMVGSRCGFMNRRCTMLFVCVVKIMYEGY